MMNRFQITIYTVLSLMLCPLWVEAESLVLEGQYQGKDIYVQNPRHTSGVGYAVKKTMVNGQVSSDEINSSAFIIDLSIFNYDIGEAVLIEIFHEDSDGTNGLRLERYKVLARQKTMNILLKWISIQEKIR